MTDVSFITIPGLNDTKAYVNPRHISTIAGFRETSSDGYNAAVIVQGITVYTTAKADDVLLDVMTHVLPVNAGTVTKVPF